MTFLKYYSVNLHLEKLKYKTSMPNPPYPYWQQ